MPRCADDAWALVAAHCLCALAVISPLFWVDIPILTDYPNHLARIWLQMNANPLGETTHYRVQWQIVPNLAIEMLLPPLARLLKLEIAGRIFIAIAMLLPCLATAWLRRLLHGHWDWWSLGAYLFVYNTTFYWGFLNYLFGMGIALVGFAAWLACEQRALAWRLPVFTVLAGFLFMLHLFAFGVYGVLVGGHTLGRLLANGRPSAADIRARLPVFIQFVPTALVWLANAGRGGKHHVEYGDLITKLYTISAPMAYGLVGPAIALSLPSVLYFSWRRGSVGIVPQMRIALLVVAVVWMLMPTILFASWQADIRLPAAAIFVLLAALDIHLRTARTGIILAIVAGAFLVVRIAALSAQWIDMDRMIATFRTALPALPSGSRILVVQDELTGGRYPVPGLPIMLAYHANTNFSHLAAFAVMDRAAFISYLFVGWTLVHPNSGHDDPELQNGAPVRPEELAMALNPAGRDILRGLRNQIGEAPYWLDWPERFDHVIWMSPGRQVGGIPPPGSTKVVPDNLTLITDGGFFRIFHVRR